MSHPNNATRNSPLLPRFMVMSEVTSILRMQQLIHSVMNMRVHNPICKHSNEYDNDHLSESVQQYSHIPNNFCADLQPKRNEWFACNSKEQNPIHSGHSTLTDVVSHRWPKKPTSHAWTCPELTLLELSWDSCQAILFDIWELQCVKGLSLRRIYSMT